MKKPSRVLDSLGEDCSAMVFPAGSKDIVGQSGGPWNDETAAQTSLPKGQSSSKSRRNPE